MYAKPTAPRSIGGVLDDAFRLFRAGFSKAWPIAVLSQAIVAVPLVIMEVQMGSAVASNKLDPAKLLAHLPLIITLYVILVIGSIIFQNAMVAQFVAQTSNTAMSIGQSLAVSLRFFSRTLGIVLMYVFGVFLVGIVVAIFGALLGGFVRGLIFIAVVVAMLIVMIRLLLANVVLIAEDTSVMGAIEGSWRLTRGNWWRVSGIVTVLAVILMVAMFVVGFAAELVALVLPRTGMLAIVLTQLLSILGDSLFMPLFAAGFLAILFDLKLRRDGTDLAGRVDALAAG